MTATFRAKSFHSARDPARIPGMTAEELLAEYPANVRAVAERLRRAILAALPDAEERVLPGWRALGYRHPEAGHVGALFPGNDEVKLYLEYGADLVAPRGVLLGETKQTRYLRFVRESQVRPRDLAPLLVAALLAAADRRKLRGAASARPRSRQRPASRTRSARTRAR
jgi:hypothetical protein